MMTSAMIEREMTSDGRPVGDGVFVAVVGPSGAGKDSLIAYARGRFAGEGAIEFVRRVVTRPSDGAAEDHDSLSEEDFAAAEARGAFSLSWRAHGLSYGLPAGVDRGVEAGHVMVANLSRAAIPALCRRHADVVVVEVVAEPEILASRIAGRARESAGDAAARLARQAGIDAGDATVVTLDNSGALEVAGERFVDLLRRALARAAIAGAV
ncbi:MAG: phosphonate metabolism protein/1,5-bisphosphokinase (PRPP-forming) PhnN [Rhizobiaceae bacterium]|nr:MAG: phosphonate metabolism protein/1,5-bisphosphokinase (PRPP-forming) PhnN [Rhizobiaceae bacterium]CAG1011638.1 ribose 1,5-bisphosphokinase [Rhizobiaceae bacterium]